jgi:hypothetical protein
MKASPLLACILLLGCGAQNPDACPANAPTQLACSTNGLSCEYADQRCTCSPGVRLWYCVPNACPQVAPNAAPSGTCQAPLDCNYGFEWSCGCIAPDNQWLCCGGVNGCPSAQPKEGELCCGAGGLPSCSYDVCGGGQRLVCDCLNIHWHCHMATCAAPMDGGTD